MENLKETTTKFYNQDNDYYNIYNKKKELLYSGKIDISNENGSGTFYGSNGVRVRYSGDWIYSKSKVLDVDNFSYKNILKHGYGILINRHTTYAEKFRGTYLFNKKIDGKAVKKTTKCIYYYNYIDNVRHLSKKKDLI